MTSERRRQRRQPPTRNVVLGGTSEEERGRLPPVATSLHVGRAPPLTPSSHRGLAVSLPRAYPPRDEFSLATPRGKHPPISSLPSQCRLSLTLSQSHARVRARAYHPSLFLRTPSRSWRSCKTPVHHRRHYPTTGFPATNQTPRLSSPIVAEAPSRARYQPAAIPTATTESRRFSASQPSDSPPRHATPRAACVSAPRFPKPASERNLIARPSHRKSSARRDHARRRVDRVHPLPGFRLFQSYISTRGD